MRSFKKREKLKKGNGTYYYSFLFILFSKNRLGQKKGRKPDFWTFQYKTLKTSALFSPRSVQNSPVLPKDQNGFGLSGSVQIDQTKTGLYKILIINHLITLVPYSVQKSGLFSTSQPTLVGEKERPLE